MTDTRDDHGKGNALAWFQSIVEMVDAMRATMPDYDVIGAEPAHEEAVERIQESVLSVEVRSGWYSAGLQYGTDKASREAVAPAEYCILLTTGGPAARLIGDLDDHGEPESAILEYQDWGTPWMTVEGLPMAKIVGGDTLEHYKKADEYLLTFARQFYFGEG